MVPTTISSAKTAAVPIILAPRTTMPPSFSPTTRRVRSSSSPAPAGFVSVNAA